MRFMPSENPKNSTSLGVLGYLIIVNKQIHSYQLNILKEYLGALNLEIGSTVIANIIDGKDDCISFASSLAAFETEDELIQKDIYYVLIALSSVDNAIDDNELTLINKIVSVSKMTKSEIEELKKVALSDAVEIRCSNDCLFEKPKPATVVVEAQDFFIQFFHRVINFFRRLLGLGIVETPQEVIEQGDVDYKASIEQCAAVATEDFRIVRPSYSTIIKKGTECIDELKRYKSSLSLKTGLSADVANIVKVVSGKPHVPVQTHLNLR